MRSRRYYHGNRPGLRWFATIPVGNGSYGTAFSRDGTHAYVTNEGSGTVSVIDVARNSVINTITVGSEPTNCD